MSQRTLVTVSSSLLTTDGVLLRGSHWQNHAQQWQHIGSPLRPVVADIQYLEQVLEQSRLPSCGTVSTGQALLLGVTPEIATMRWPLGTQLLALDRCPEMIAQVWPQRGLPPKAQAVVGDWSQIPLPDHSCDWVIGDGCFTLLSYPDAYQQVLQAVYQVLRPGGGFAMRFFLRPTQPESLATVEDDLWAGRIKSFHSFKWQLAMALHGSLAEGVWLTDVWEACQAMVPEPQQLAQRLGWSVDAIATIHAYRGVTSRYTFPTLTEVRHIFSHWFIEVDSYFPDYELGERCPTLIFQPHSMGGLT